MPEYQSKARLPYPTEKSDNNKAVQIEEQYPQFIDNAERLRRESDIEHILWEVFSKFDVTKEKS